MALVVAPITATEAGSAGLSALSLAGWGIVSLIAAALRVWGPDQ